MDRTFAAGVHQSTHATGYLSLNIDLTFVVLFCLGVLVVIFCTFTLCFEGAVMHL